MKQKSDMPYPGWPIFNHVFVVVVTVTQLLGVEKIVNILRAAVPHINGLHIQIMCI